MYCENEGEKMNKYQIYTKTKTERMLKKKSKKKKIVLYTVKQTTGQYPHKAKIVLKF